MQTLKFLGRGSAFNTREGNTSAYIKEGNSLLLIDCGENIFDRITKVNLLYEVDKVDVLITHLNSDHVGSLSSLIYYCCYIKKIKANVYFPTDELEELLRLMGHTQDEYNFNYISEIISENITDSIRVMALETKHIDNMDCFGYIIDYNNIAIYYSGDSNVFEIVTTNDFEEFDEIYQDTCSADYEGNVHLSLKKLCESVPKEYRNKVYCMHIDKDELIDNSKLEGFNVVELS